MSPERIQRKVPDVLRTSKGAARAERKRLSAARKIDPNAERLNRFSIPSREQVLATVELRTHNNEALNSLFLNNTPVIIDFIDARIAIANDEDWTKYEEFLKKLNDTYEDPKSPSYDPELIDNLK